MNQIDQISQETATVTPKPHIQLAKILMTAHELNKSKIKSDLPDLRPGMTVRVHQKIKEIVLTEKLKGKVESKEKERVQVFEGIILAIKHGRSLNATMTVRKISEGVGVERIFPLHLPSIQKIEIVKQAKVHRAKLYYLRDYKKRLKETRTKS